MKTLHALDTARGHSLVPTGKELATIPRLYETDGMPLNQKTIHLRYFAGGSAQWLINEVDPDSFLMFGYCDLGMGTPEWGYVSLVELCELEANGPYGMPIYAERDLSWQPQLWQPRPFDPKVTHRRRFASIFVVLIVLMLLARSCGGNDEVSPLPVPPASSATVTPPPTIEDTAVQPVPEQIGEEVRELVDSTRRAGHEFADGFNADTTP